MELFFTNNISGTVATLDKEESKHCVKVLRHKIGDSIRFIDGDGGFYTGEISGITGSECKIRIITKIEDYAPREYYLHMAVAPTKNLERYEWFMEKATELGLDALSPIFGEHSERRVFKTERGERIFLSATKQSIKAKLPVLNQIRSFKDFVLSTGAFEGVKLIAHCNTGLLSSSVERKSLLKLLEKSDRHENFGNRFLVLIGPEGDFSSSEVELALSQGFIPISLGDSILRTETAALMVVTALYLLRNRE